VKLVRPSDDERAGHVRAAQPFLAGDGVVVDRARIDREHAGRLRAVDENRQARLGFEPDRIERVAAHPGDV
jgi:hypothetical protein